ALRLQGNFEAALASYRRAIELDPALAEAHSNYAMLLLLRGEFEQGWPEYEWRWTVNMQERPGFRQARWDGSPLGTRTILLYAEQGMGNTIQFIRYASLVKNQNPQATVIVECQPQLTRLLARCPGIDQLIGRSGDVPHFNVNCPLLSLPRLIHPSLATIP